MCTYGQRYWNYTYRSESHIVIVNQVIKKGVGNKVDNRQFPVKDILQTIFYL